jgi:hypothetical protein
MLGQRPERGSLKKLNTITHLGAEGPGAFILP